MTQAELLRQEMAALTEEQRRSVYASIANLVTYAQGVDPGDDEALAAFILREYVAKAKEMTP